MLGHFYRAQQRGWDILRLLATSFDDCVTLERELSSRRLTFSYCFSSCKSVSLVLSAMCGHSLRSPAPLLSPVPYAAVLHCSGHLCTHVCSASPRRLGVIDFGSFPSLLQFSLARRHQRPASMTAVESSSRTGASYCSEPQVLAIV
jgi:hypothetical protein